MLLGLVVLLPIPLSGFITVKYTYFLGWGLTFYLLAVSADLIQLQLQTTKRELERLGGVLADRQTLARFLAPTWAGWLGRGSVGQIQPGDRRGQEAVLLEIRAPTDVPWLPLVGKLAEARGAGLVDWRDGAGIWALAAWSEVALEFSLEVRRGFSAAGFPAPRIGLTRCEVAFEVLNLGSQWHAAVSGLPAVRLDELLFTAERYGAAVVLDSSLRDGLAVGAWRRHRQLTAAGTEIEFYEGEDEALAALKDATLDTFEEALSHARNDDLEAATEKLLSVVQRNPFDVAAKAHLTTWGRGPGEANVSRFGTGASPRPR
jgi:hypothetical protein